MGRVEESVGPRNANALEMHLHMHQWGADVQEFAIGTFDNYVHQTWPQVRTIQKSLHDPRAIYQSEDGR